MTPAGSFFMNRQSSSNDTRSRGESAALRAPVCIRTAATLAASSSEARRRVDRVWLDVFMGRPPFDCVTSLAGTAGAKPYRLYSLDIVNRPGAMLLRR